MRYVRIRSWHLIALRAPAIYTTRCGRMVPTDAPTSDSLPLGERSCETCLRLARRDEERA